MRREYILNVTRHHDHTHTFTLRAAKLETSKETQHMRNKLNSTQTASQVQDRLRDRETTMLPCKQYTHPSSLMKFWGIEEIQWLQKKKKVAKSANVSVLDYFLCQLHNITCLRFGQYHYCTCTQKK